MVTKIIDILLIVFRLLGELPRVYDQIQVNRKDTKYKTDKAARDAAYGTFVIAKKNKDIKAQLEALKKLHK